MNLSPEGTARSPSPPHADSGTGSPGPPLPTRTEPEPPLDTALAFEEVARLAFLASRRRPLCLYAHIPFCRHRCTFCPFFINRCHGDFSSDYTALVARDIAITADLLGADRRARPATALYFGGGTPGDLAAPDLADLLDHFQSHFHLTPETEITIEGRIRDFTSAKAEAWVAAGANRFSLGLQTSDTRLRRRLGRLADRKEIRRVLAHLSATGAVVIVDLIYGLPGQGIGSVAEDIRFLAEETPVDGLDLYALRRFPGSPLDSAVAKKHLPPYPDPELQEALLNEGELALEAHGFERFAPRHWRRNPCEQSLYNQYARQEADILPFGSAAGGRLDAYQLACERDYSTYATAVLAGRKPVQVRRVEGS